MGMKPRKVGQIPSKTDLQEQEAFKEAQLEPRLFERLFVKALSGWQRLNVLAALNATTKEIFTVQNLTYVTAETVCELLRLLAKAHPGVPNDDHADNARYQIRRKSHLKPREVYI
jgi:hypothetical protein